MLPAAEPPVAIEDIDFSQEKAGGVTDEYIQARIEIVGGPNESPDAPNARFNEKIGIKLSVGFEVPGKGFQFYEADCTLVAIEQGEKKNVYFYIPPEIVDIHRLPEDPFAYLVELTVAGKEVPPTKENVSSSLNSASVIASFKSRVAQGASENDGIMLPIYKTLFWSEINNRRLRDTPTYLIKSGAQ